MLGGTGGRKVSHWSIGSSVTSDTDSTGTPKSSESVARSCFKYCARIGPYCSTISEASCWYSSGTTARQASTEAHGRMVIGKMALPAMTLASTVRSVEIPRFEATAVVIVAVSTSFGSASSVASKESVEGGCVLVGGGGGWKQMRQP